MKLGLFWIVSGAILLIDGGIRIAWFGWPGLTGVVIAIPLFYWGIKRLQSTKG